MLKRWKIELEVLLEDDPEVLSPNDWDYIALFDLLPTESVTKIHAEPVDEPTEA